MSKIELFPLWRNAVKEANAIFDYGDTIPSDWLWDSFEIDKNRKMDYEESRRISLDFMQHMEQFKEELLVEHKKYLMSIPGTGYKVVNPDEQTSAAMERLRKTVTKELRKAGEALEHINTAMMDSSAINHNEEAKGKLAFLRMQTQRKLVRRM